MNRIATNPERLANVYFDTVLVLRAIARAAPYLEAYDIETARSQNDLTGIEADKKVKQQLKAVLEMARESGASAFDEKALFNGDDAIVSHASNKGLHCARSDQSITRHRNSAINSSTISGTYLGFLTARVVTNADYGVNCKSLG